MKKLAFLFVFFIVTINCVFAQKNDLDPSFGLGKGYVTSDFGVNEAGARIHVLKTGKIIAVGISFDTIPNDTAEIIFARYTSSGVLDSTYGANGIVYTGLKAIGSFLDCDWAGYDWAAFQDDDKIVLSIKYPDTSSSYIELIRFDTAGFLDNTFNGNGHIITQFPGNYETAIYGIRILENGKIMVTGGFDYDVNKTVGLLLVRYKNNGELDSTFNGTGIVELDPGTTNLYLGLSILPELNGQIYIGVFDGLHDATGIVRFNSNGTIDRSFGKNGLIFDTSFHSVACPIPKFAFDIANSKFYMTQNGQIDRYNASGNLDSTFNSTGTLNFKFKDKQIDIFSLFIQPDSKLLLGGNGIIRINFNGSFDNTFGDNGFDTSLLIYSVSIDLQPDNKIITGSYSFNKNVDIGVARLLPGITSGVNNRLLPAPHLLILPNPCKTCKLSINGDSKDLMITDILGKNVEATFTKSPGGWYINLPDAVKGMFIIRDIKTGETAKFIKE